MTESPSIAEDVARDLQEKLIEYGYHGSTHCEIEHYPSPLLAVFLDDFTESHSEKTSAFSDMVKVCRDHGWHVSKFDFVLGAVHLKQD